MGRVPQDGLLPPFCFGAKTSPPPPLITPPWYDDARPTLRGFVVLPKSSRALTIPEREGNGKSCLRESRKPALNGTIPSESPATERDCP